MVDADLYNPLSRENLGGSVADALLKKDVFPIGKIDKFEGAGLYAIYYDGPFKPYLSLSQKNSNNQWAAPIYVGKSIPPGARKGGVGLGAKAGPALHKRIKEHRNSIKIVSNLDHEDFFVRVLVVEDIWIPLGEALLIARFSPLWNQLIDGFGNHTPGKGRFEQERSRWDVLHPGRPWALKCQERKESAEDIENEIISYLKFAPN